MDLPEDKVNRSVVPLNVCRFCINHGCYKDIFTGYYWLGQTEIYEEMFKETFDICISFLDDGGSSNGRTLICEDCISKLRDALAFKRKVLESELNFTKHFETLRNRNVIPSELKLNEEEITVRVKDEYEENTDNIEDYLHDSGCSDNADCHGSSLLELKDEVTRDGINEGIPHKANEDIHDCGLLIIKKEVIIDGVKEYEKNMHRPDNGIHDLTCGDNADVGDIEIHDIKLENKDSNDNDDSDYELTLKSLKTKFKNKRKKNSPITKTTIEKKAKLEEEEEFVESTTKKNSDVTSTGVHTEPNQVVNETTLSEDSATNYNRRSERNNFIIILECSNVCPFRWRKNLYLCFYCDEHFSDPSDLRDHNLKDHHSISTQQIKTALKRLKTYELVKVDVTNVNCKLCPEFVKDFTNLKLHIQAKHNTNFDNNTSDGILPFKLTNKYHCALCEEKYNNFKLLYQHMKRIHFRNFICQQCGSGFTTADSLRSHTSTHKTVTYSCDSCDKVFKYARSRNEHIASIHLQVNRNRCPHCPETFRNYTQRTKHITAVHGLKTEFKCSFCPKVFLFNDKLRHHVGAVHLKVKNHACHICDSKFYSKSELNAHMVRHGGEKKFECLVCGKAFTRKCTLREHTRIHDDNKKFACTICGMRFLYRYALKQHLIGHYKSGQV